MLKNINKIMSQIDNYSKISSKIEELNPNSEINKPIKEYEDKHSKNIITTQN